MRAPTRFLLPSALLLLLAGGPVRADGPAVARCVTDAASLLRRPGPDQPWRAAARNEAMTAGGTVLGVTDAALDSADGAVRLAFVGDLTGTSPFPVLETAVTLNDPQGVDLDLTLERGRIDLVNRKPSGPARVRIRGRDRSCEVVLTDPGARLAVEVYSRWPRGTRFTKDPRSGEGPTVGLAVLALRGSVELKGAHGEVTLQAPPGPALILGDSLETLDHTPQHLDRLPDWADEGRAESSERARRARAALAKFRGLAAAGSVDAALDKLLQSDDAGERRAGVYLSGALDELPRLATALADARHPDVWDAGVLALRHWVGRGPGQPQKLYRGLVEKAGFPPAQAASVVQLLFSPGEADLARPATYQMLIDFLSSDKLALRGLANWHLARLVPAGRAFGYNPLGTPEERERATAEWRKLIPEGQLPPRTGPANPGTVHP
jgi:hypothetical protein